MRRLLELRKEQGGESGFPLMHYNCAFGADGHLRFDNAFFFLRAPHFGRAQSATAGLNTNSVFSGRYQSKIIRTLIRRREMPNNPFSR